MKFARKGKAAPPSSSSAADLSEVEMGERTERTTSSSPRTIRGEDNAAFEDEKRTGIEQTIMEDQMPEIGHLKKEEKSR
jgi:hypothetical protein